MKLIFFLIFFISLNIYSQDFEIEIFFTAEKDGTDIIEFPNNTNYRHVKNTANWQNSFGDYGILKCLFNISLGQNNKNASLEGYCNGKNQNNERFWLQFKRDTDDFDAGIGRSQFIFGTGRYKEFIGTKCIYAVKILDQSAFSKHKCKL